jgi:hypothetical protein
MASLDDLLTTQKNGVVAINNLGRAYLRSQGNVTSATVSADTLVISGSGYLVNWSVVVAGSTAGGVYNTNAISSAATANQLAVIGNTVGVTNAGLNFSSGLVIKVGSGMSVNVTYSVG